MTDSLKELTHKTIRRFWAIESHFYSLLQVLYYNSSGEKRQNYYHRQQRDGRGQAVEEKFLKEGKQEDQWPRKLDGRDFRAMWRGMQPRRKPVGPVGSESYDLEIPTTAMGESETQS